MRSEDRKTNPVFGLEADYWTTAVCITALAVGLIITFFVYRPDRVLPFDFVDFSEFLPLLRRDSSLERLNALFDYYLGQQGRANVVAYVGLALKWELFQDYSPAWQWIRFGVMWCVIVLTYRLLRRIGGTPLSSIAGATLFTFSPPAVDGWTRLTMAEPTGTVLLLAASMLALTVPKEPGREIRIGLGFAAICAVMVLLKEMMAAVMVFPIALVVALPTRLLGFPRLARARTLFIAAAIAIPLASIPVVVTMLTARSDAYTADFGSKFRPIGDVFAQWSLGVLPFSPGTSFPPMLVGLALVSIALVLVGGWTLRLRKSASRTDDDRLIFWLAIIFPLFGAATYLPWPSYNRFYAIPFLLGGAILTSGALSGLEAASRRLATGGYIAWLMFLVFAGADAFNQSNRMAERQRINRDVVARLSIEAGPTDTVFLATEQQPPTFWQGIGPTLQRYGEALGYPMPRVINAPCADSKRMALSGQHAVVFYNSLCRTSRPGIALAARYHVLRLPSLHPVADSIRVDVVLPTSQGRSP